MRIQVKVVAVACLALLASIAVPNAVGAEETFNAGIARVAGPSGRGMPSQLIMTVKEWSTPKERMNLLRALQEGGDGGLLDALSEMDKGFLRYPASTGWPINHAWSEETAEGRVVRFITERPVIFGEAYRNTRTLDYTVGIVELRLDKEGKGEGVLIPMAKVELNEERGVVVENFGTQPNRLMGVTARTDD